MDKNMDFPGYGPFGSFDFDPNLNEMYKENAFNPMFQYEQAYVYYRALCMQMEYKIKCKEYEKLCSGKTDRKIE